jgi:hypothetical protein
MNFAVVTGYQIFRLCKLTIKIKLMKCLVVAFKLSNPIAMMVPAKVKCNPH